MAPRIAMGLAVRPARDRSRIGEPIPSAVQPKRRRTDPMAKVPRSLAGLTIAITGGGRGIGRATAKALLAQGARVAIGDIEQPLAEQTAAELGSATIGLHVDVTDRASFGSFLDQVEQRLGPLDALINNAGIMPVGPFVEEDDATATRMVDINV